MSGLFHEVYALLARGERVAMASITIQKGSSPRGSGTRCAFREDGTIIGTIGGGLLEAKTREAAVDALGGDRHRYLDFNLTNDELAASGMVCGGTLQVLVSVWSGDEYEVAGRLAQGERQYSRGVLVTTWDDGKGSMKVAYCDDEDDLQTCGDSQKGRLIKETIDSGKATVSITGKEGVVVERIEPENLPLIVFGGGHIGMALGAIAPEAGFDVTIVDDRKEIAEKDPPPGVGQIVFSSVEDFFAGRRLNGQTFIVICTPGHQSDARCAVESLRSEALYVGMIGSRRKSRIVIEHLKVSGISEERLEALHTPTGLEIGAQTPGEIAISILAEMIKIRHLGNGKVP